MLKLFIQDKISKKKKMNLLVLFIMFSVVISVHESSHALAAYLLGDETAKNSGRLTLNPVAHLDLIGTLLIFFIGFGWGKPVPVNPNYFKKPVRDNAIVAVAGPLSNIVMALFGIIVLKYFIATAIVEQFIYLNIILAVFNLIPLPPLDGSHVLELIIGERLREIYIIYQQQITYYFFIFLLADAYFQWGLIFYVLRITSDFIYYYLYLIS